MDPKFNEACADKFIAEQIEHSANKPKAIPLQTNPTEWLCQICQKPNTGEPAYAVDSMAGPFRYCHPCWHGKGHGDNCNSTEA